MAKRALHPFAVTLLEIGAKAGAAALDSILGDVEIGLGKVAAGVRKTRAWRGSVRIKEAEEEE